MEYYVCVKELQFFSDFYGSFICFSCRHGHEMFISITDAFWHSLRSVMNPNCFFKPGVIVINCINVTSCDCVRNLLVLMLDRTWIASVWKTSASLYLCHHKIYIFCYIATPTAVEFTEFNEYEFNLTLSRIYNTVSTSLRIAFQWLIQWYSVSRFFIVKKKKK